MPDDQDFITPDMTVLDIISTHRETEGVFKKYDQEAGECICCNALFDSLEHMAQRYGLNLENLLADLKNAPAK
jgi:hypothetical protein